MQTIYLLCGILGSGKSTWAKEKANEGVVEGQNNIVIINRDAIRLMIKGRYVFDYDYEPFIKAACYDMVVTALDYELDIIIDETNITKKHRAEWFDLIDIAAQDRHVDIGITIVHFKEKVNNVANRMTSPKGMSQEEWQKIYEGMLANFEEPSLLEEFPTGSKLIEVSI